jgi:CRISPR/Cas system-associated exonuclease Cas4 (RecB family)
MKLSVSEILDYKKCPLYYQFRYVNGIEEDLSVPQEIHDEIHRLIYFFYYGVMDNKPALDILALKKKWGKMWFKDIDGEKYILTPKNDRSEAGIKAVPLIEHFHNFACQRPCMPLAVEQSFSVDIGDHTVSGMFEVVREVQDGPRRLIEITNYKTGTQVPIQWNVDYDLSLSLQSYAFRQLFNAKEQRILVHYLRSDRVFATHRSNDHFDRMAKTIDLVARSITRGLFYPRETFLCNSCFYQNYCTVWK